MIDIVEAFRAIDSNQDAIPVLGDEEAMRVLVAWSKTDQRWKAPRTKPPAMRPGNHATVWRWVVEGWTIDVTAVAKIAGVQVRVARDKLDMLVGLRLIFPDGVMASSAKTALNVHVAGKLGVKQRAQRRAAPDKGETHN